MQNIEKAKKYTKSQEQQKHQNKKRVNKLKMKTFSLHHFPLEHKTVFLRVDYNVPLEPIPSGQTRSKQKLNQDLKQKKQFSHRKVADNSKIRESLPTIHFLLKNKCKIVIGTHFGRPEGKILEEFKLDPIAKELQRLLPKIKITKLEDSIGEEIKTTIDRGKPGEIFILENLRFYKEEEDNNPAFAHALADLADLYINDAFSNSHRKHASMDAITHFLPSLPGMSVEKEVKYLSHALRPAHPSIWILGGAKLDKVDLVNVALKRADIVLIGGALAFSFLKAQGISVGMSKVDTNSVEQAKKIFHQNSKKNLQKIILPVDFLAAKQFSLTAHHTIVPVNHISSQDICLDLGPETINLFKRYLRKAKTIVWNGPLGYFEWTKYSKGTADIGRYISQLTATTICGGGETITALDKFHLTSRMSHASTSGGAFLSFITEKKMPALEALEKNYVRFKKKVH